MFLVEIKLGAFKIRRYVLTADQIDKLITENPQYEYVKIIKEIKPEEEINEPKTRKKVKNDEKKPMV